MLALALLAAAAKLGLVLSPDTSAETGPFEPVGATDENSESQLSRDLLTTFNPFSASGGAGPEAVSSTFETSLNLRLAGIRSSDGERPSGSAIIGLPEGQQILVNIGEEVAPQTFLIGIGSAHVHLSHQGREEMLSFDLQRQKLLQAQSGEALEGRSLSGASSLVTQETRDTDDQVRSVSSPEMQNAFIARQLRAPRQASAPVGEFVKTRLAVQSANAEDGAQALSLEGGR